MPASTQIPISIHCSSCSLVMGCVYLDHKWIVCYMHCFSRSYWACMYFLNKQLQTNIHSVTYVSGIPWIFTHELRIDSTYLHYLIQDMPQRVCQGHARNGTTDLHALQKHCRIALSTCMNSVSEEDVKPKKWNFYLSFIDVSVYQTSDWHSWI